MKLLPIKNKKPRNYFRGFLFKTELIDFIILFSLK